MDIRYSSDLLTFSFFMVILSHVSYHFSACGPLTDFSASVLWRDGKLESQLYFEWRGTVEDFKKTRSLDSAQWRKECDLRGRKKQSFSEISMRLRVSFSQHVCFDSKSNKFSLYTILHNAFPNGTKIWKTLFYYQAELMFWKIFCQYSIKKFVSYSSHYTLTYNIVSIFTALRRYN